MSKNLKSQQPNLKDKLETKVKKTTEKLLDCAVTGRLMYSYWKAENTAISIKEIRKQSSMKDVNNKPRFTMKEKLNILWN